jgi:hypothetical protein
MIDLEPLIRTELESLMPMPEGSRRDWADVLARSGQPHPGVRGGVCCSCLLRAPAPWRPAALRVPSSARRPRKDHQNRSLSRSARFEVGAITLKLCPVILETHGSSFKLGAFMVASLLPVPRSLCVSPRSRFVP